MCVKGVPSKVSHIDRVLDGGQGCIWKFARLGALRKGLKILTHIDTAHKCLISQYN